MIVAIDGPAGSGKSTTARLLARRLDFLYLDTGAMYRAVGVGVARRGLLDDEEAASDVVRQLTVELLHDDGRHRVLLDGEDVSEALRDPQAGLAASRVSAWPEVRKKMVAEQRRMARRATAAGRGVVLDGRDIGTDVFPDADVKIFMEAAPDVRARRRFEELQAAGVATSFDDVLAEINRRDLQDATRAIAPLRKASDAIVLDTTGRTIDEQVEFVLQKVRERASIRAGRP